MLEIGPGPGALTSPLSESYETVAVEFDPRMADVLHASAPKARVFIEDALKCDLRALVAKLPGPVCVVSNMPYNITGPLLARISDLRGGFRNAVLMMQKEVGERILAEPGKSERGSLSVCLQLQFQIKRVCSVPPSAFNPPPKVDSIVLDFWPSPVVVGEDKVFETIRTGFTQPRKTLANNLRARYGQGRAVSVIEEIGLAKNVRPHELTNDQWVELARRL